MYYLTYGNQYVYYIDYDECKLYMCEEGHKPVTFKTWEEACHALAKTHNLFEYDITKLEE